MKYIQAKSILSGYSSKGWFGCNYNMNIYRGCNHGCIYCDSRSACYQVENFDCVRAKENALVILERELACRKHKGTVGIGAMSDPYNQCENTELLTRGALALISRHGYGIVLATKSALVTRDIDLFNDISKRAAVNVQVTITAARDSVSSLIEPRAASSSQRFAALEQLSAHGVYCGILLMPVLPFITGTVANIRALVQQAADCGAHWIYPAFGVTLRSNQREWFYERLDERWPGLRAQYAKNYGNAYECACANQTELRMEFEQSCSACNIKYKMRDIVEGYSMPNRPEQISLF